jgi:hypothetical protein
MRLNLVLDLLDICRLVTRGLYGGSIRIDGLLLGPAEACDVPRCGRAVGSGLFLGLLFSSCSRTAGWAAASCAARSSSSRFSTAPLCAVAPRPHRGLLFSLLLFWCSAQSAFRIGNSNAQVAGMAKLVLAILGQETRDTDQATILIE